MPTDDLEHAEQLKRLIVDPVAERLEAKIDDAIKPLIAEQVAAKTRLAAAESMIGNLNAKWGKVLIGFTVWSTIAGILMAALTAKIRKWIGI